MDERGLYAGPFDDFVAQRRALAHHLRDAGDAAAAKAVLAWRKPTRAAWLVNVLTATDPDLVDEFLELGPQLARAHRDADGARLRELSRARSRLVDQLSSAAVEAGRTRGYAATSAVRDEVTQTLTAALADPDLAENLRAGRLIQAERASGFGPAGSLSPLAPVIPLHPEMAPRPERAQHVPAPVGPGSGADRAARLATLADQLAAAEKAAADAEAAAVAARGRADRADEGLARARDHVTDSEREVAELRARLEAAERGLEVAQGTASAAQEDASAAARAAAEADTARTRAAATLERVRAQTARELGFSSGPSS